MGRKIFNAPPAVEKSDAERPSPQSTTRLSGSVGGLRDSLREITANSIRDLDPSQIEMDGLRDRLELDENSIEELASSIRKHGQQVPIMVRPSGKPDRYKIIYGRRRLAAIRKIGGNVKAIVRTMDDDASLIAQGQENNLRLDPSFIEKSLFIKEMQEHGFKPSIIQEALGLSRQGVSNHRIVLELLPEKLIKLIGPAHGVGRRQWSELGALSAKSDIIEVVENALSGLPEGTPSLEKFNIVFAACRKNADSGRTTDKRAQTSTVVDKNSRPLGTITLNDKAIVLKIVRKNNPEFAKWLESHAENSLVQLFEQWSSANESNV